MAQFSSGKYAFQICDICADREPYGTLKEIYEKGTPTGVLACKRCWSSSHPQLRVGERKVVDPQSLRDARPDPGQDASRAITVDNVTLAQELGIYDQLDLGE
jgi:hypothetical protein